MDVDLPKWSRIVISGRDVTKDQAAEIILRTDGLYFSCNDDEWKRQLHQCLGIKNLDNYFEELQIIKEKLKILDLDYLRNRQIASSYIFGPHGWCSWEGKIGCDGYNIGKYPTVESVLEEWKLIANTWKFLDLKCQLWDGEYYEEESRPVIEFIVKNGEVTSCSPKNVLFHEKTTSDDFRPLYRYGERGCTIEKFKNALELLK